MTKNQKKPKRSKGKPVRKNTGAQERQQFLKKYEVKFSLTLENIAKIPDGELPNAMWEYYLRYCDYTEKKKHKKYLTAKDQRALDRTLPRGLRLVRSVMRFDGDILNGGIAQYVSNHSPEEVFEDLEALRTIGASKSEKILRRALTIYKRVHGWPSEHKESKIDPWERPSLERLDDLRCNQESSRRDFVILDTYLRKHLDECVLPIEVTCNFVFMDTILRSLKGRR